jgi:histone acetyltransferase (RNA polymerase elongator complex component)
VPNYSAMGKVPLTMECPHCGAMGEHRVERTDPSYYKWSDEASVIFKQLIGKDISFRQRTKRCVKCRKSFISVEMAKNYLGTIINGLLKNQKTIEALRKRNKSIEDEKQKLQTKLLKIHKFTASEKERT